MKVLMISGDPGVLDLNAEAGKRTEEYRRVLGGLDVIVCRKNIFNFIDKFLQAQGMMWQKKYDVITAQDIEHSFLAWMLSRLHSVSWQMQIHTDIFSPHFVRSPALPAGRSALNKIRVRLAKFLIPRADCIRVVSGRIKDSVTWRLSRQVAAKPPIAVLPVFVDVEKIENAPIKSDLHEKYGRDKFIILMASRITREKNIGLAIDALASGAGSEISLTPSRKRSGSYSAMARPRLEISFPAPESLPMLLIVGNGPELANLKLQVTGYKLQDSVKFESRTDDLASYYKTCDLFLLTSDYEGYGMTLVEAAAAGAKIISSDVGIAPEILEQECIFKVGNKEDLKQKLLLALENKLPAPHLPLLPTKDEYLRLYKESLAICLK